jgi:hypothetical protein
MRAASCRKWRTSAVVVALQTQAGRMHSAWHLCNRGKGSKLKSLEDRFWIEPRRRCCQHLDCRTETCQLFGMWFLRWATWLPPSTQILFQGILNGHHQQVATTTSEKFALVNTSVHQSPNQKFKAMASFQLCFRNPQPHGAPNRPKHRSRCRCWKLWLAERSKTRPCWQPRCLRFSSWLRSMAHFGNGA